MKTFLTFLFFAVCISFAFTLQCSNPPPADGYTLSKYLGLWYEIARIQTPGGAYFQKDCVCTIITVTEPTVANSNATTIDQCREFSPQGEITTETGQLFNENPPGMNNALIVITIQGKYQEQFYSYVPPVTYTVIILNDTYAVEYDCGTSLGITNYCIHVMSRTPTMDPSLMNQLFAEAEAMGLNPENLPVMMTNQTGCWNDMKSSPITIN